MIDALHPIEVVLHLNATLSQLCFTYSPDINFTCRPLDDSTWNVATLPMDGGFTPERA